ncbi:MAG: hypothetical protein A3G32_05370 [Deltaproteobacteria bacterium RIFCSPLOWO2_12_FULL_40_28]|nr:MAG: hypothetical protein A3C45_09480 [Deltaproteobacteria bacterium RIFCSPHIGHO2_02_FULL_40_28]OGQ19788.1 MAG: hypothetical protein A3E27_08675 [Deltaproteobacteria bacterium RIFCSPHIGHO2_12_FULL_40_32]OGQ41065.1 MAG: hypothetical protein A3I69_04090 [Deltaproteobacteria bacterium RIFCSPLOWO2_02_FULL_40_36]OGQ54181.1 MAG: hypothetical protein A3G32_05370 [Deltaproteobacteria bacterium RIFCSPLOWO2_12_FULL_40_28]
MRILVKKLGPSRTKNKKRQALEIIKFLRELELTSLVTRQGLNLFRSPRLKIITKTTYKKTQMDIHAII